jgi:predicted nuclease of restriction endonuclease-like RecB superfamily
VLTNDLVRVRLKGSTVEPRYVGVSNGDLRKEARGLIELHLEHQGRSVGELEEALALHIGDSPRFLVQRGLSKLLMDRATVEVEAVAEPSVVRECVFRLAVESGPVAPGHVDRETILDAAGRELRLSREDIENSLYADLRSQERLRSIEEIEVTPLLHRYNMATAQAVLLRANHVRVDLEALSAKELRFLFRSLKFHRLMHRVTRKKEKLTLELDGPLSLFNMTTRYGLGLALFLPSLCLFERWSLSAQLSWGKKRETKSFELSSEQGLRSEVQEKGLWEGKEEKHFRASFRALKSPWKLRRTNQIITLSNNEVLIPDYELISTLFGFGEQNPSLRSSNNVLKKLQAT